MGMVVEGLSAPTWWSNTDPLELKYTQSLFILVQKFHNDTVQNPDGLILDF